MTIFDSSFLTFRRSLPSFHKIGLKDITTGKTQLPDFQRGWVWDDDYVNSLLVAGADEMEAN